MRDTLIIFGAIMAVLAFLVWHESNSVAPGQLALAPNVSSQASASQAAIPQAKKLKRHSKTASHEKAVKKQKYLHGVPVQDFLSASHNSLPSQVSPNRPNGVRVFLQCMEVVQGKTAELSERECKQVANRNQSSDRRAVQFGF